MALKKETIKKLRALKRSVLADPEHYNQSHYADKSACGTTCCLAGFQVRNDVSRDGFRRRVNSVVKGIPWGGKGNDIFRFHEAARESLGLTEEQANLLFGGWLPYPFHNEYRSATDGKGRAKAAARRIEHFIRTGGAE